MRICFVANYSKTYLFDEIGKKLRESTGAEICWIVVNRKLCDYLLKSYPSEQVLYLDKSFINKATEPVGEFCINEIIYGDRALRHSMGDAVKYLTHIQKPISDFMQQKNIKVFLVNIPGRMNYSSKDWLRVFPSLILIRRLYGSLMEDSVFFM